MKTILIAVVLGLAPSGCDSDRCGEARVEAMSAWMDVIRADQSRASADYRTYLDEQRATGAAPHLPYVGPAARRWSHASDIWRALRDQVEVPDEAVALLAGVVTDEHARRTLQVVRRECAWADGD